MSVGWNTVVLEAAVGVACCGYLISVYARSALVKTWESDHGPVSEGSIVASTADGHPTSSVLGGVPDQIGPVQRRLTAAGWRFGVATYGLLLVGCGLGGYGVGSLISGGRLWPAVAIALGGIWALDSAVRAYGRFRADRFESRLVDAVDAMIGALRAGQNLQQAVESAASSCREPVRSELTRLARVWGLGLGVEPSLVDLSRRFDSEGTRLWCQTLIAKSSVGGEPATILTKVNEIIRRRARLRRRLKSRLAGSQMSALLVTLLPYVLFPVYHWQRPEWFVLLTTEPEAQRLLIGAAILQGLGLLWIRRILRVDL